MRNVRNVLDKYYRGNQNTLFVFNKFFPENNAIYEIMQKKCGRARQATDESVTQHCMLHN